MSLMALESTENWSNKKNRFQLRSKVLDLQVECLVPDRRQGPRFHRSVDHPLSIARHANRAVRIAQSCNISHRFNPE